MNKRIKVWILVGTAAVTAGLVFCLKRIPQDMAYHNFADAREWLGIPNFWNVMGNVCFLLVGVWGWFELSWRRVWAGGRVIYGVLFGGIFLTGLGSAYYHWSPDNDRLIWDRIPMTIVFMSLLAAVIGEWVERKAAVWLLGPLIGLGVFSVLWWHHTELTAQGDLRLYGWVQFFPTLAIVLIMMMFGEKGNRTGVRSLIWVVVWYAVAKGLESFDKGIFSAMGFVSGHALKHVAAAASTAYLVGMFRERYPETSSSLGIFMKRNLKYWFYGVVGLVVLALLVVPIAFYRATFSGPKSANASDWASFGTFFYLFVAIANLVVFVCLSLLVLQYTRKNDQMNRQFQARLAKPVLVMSRRSDGSPGWVMDNVGKGPALNLIVGEANSTDWFGPNVKAYALPDGGKLKLDWLRSAGVICVIFEDMQGYRHLAVTQGDVTANEVVDGDLDLHMGKFEFTKDTVAAWLNRKTIVMGEARKRWKKTSSTIDPDARTVPPPGP